MFEELIKKSMIRETDVNATTKIDEDSKTKKP
jgi:hypothetical protein